MGTHVLRMLAFTTVALLPAFASKAQTLPNTPECWEYVSYARNAGAMNTLGPLIELYNLCMNSAYKRPEVRQYECAPGTYLSYYNGQPRCVLSLEEGD